MPFGAIAYYTFDNAANLGQDSTGNYNGTLKSNTGGAVGTQVARQDRRRHQPVRRRPGYHPTALGLRGLHQAMTISSGWVYYNSNQNWARILDFGNGAGSDNILMANQGGSSTLRFQIYRGRRERRGGQGVANALPTGQWLHVSRDPHVRRRNATTTPLTSTSTAPRCSPTITTASPTTSPRTLNYIGRSNWGGTACNGYMDNTFVYNRRLTTAKSIALPGQLSGRQRACLPRQPNSGHGHQGGPGRRREPDVKLNRRPRWYHRHRPHGCRPAPTPARPRSKKRCRPPPS